MKVNAIAIILWNMLHFMVSCNDSATNLNKDEIRALLDQKLEVKSLAYLIRNVNLITMESDEVVTGMDVYIKEKKIERISVTGVAEEGYVIIDGTNLFLIPGLADMHVHFINDAKHNQYNTFLFLASGVTSARIMWGVEGNILMRDEINSGKLLGPRIFVASGGFNGSVPLWPGTILTNSLDEVRSQVQRFKALGYDFIKIYGNISQEHFDVLVEESYKAGLKPLGHLPHAVSMAHAMNMKQYSIEHLGGFSQLSPGSISFSEAVQTSLQNGTWHCPTLIVQNRSSLLVSQYKTEEYYSLISPNWKTWYTYPLAQPPSNSPSQGHQARLAILRALHENGVNIISGTDMGIRYIYPGISLHEELSYYVSAGLTPYEALRTSTKNISLFLQDETTGIIDKDRRADLVLLRDNPLIKFLIYPP
jgi:Amidohydrolase family